MGIKTRFSCGILLLMAGIASAQDLSVMTYNIRYDTSADGPNAWKFRKDFLIRQVAYHAPDVLGIQEGLAHQVEAMDAGLPQYTRFGRGRDSLPTAGEFSAVFYREDHLELEESGTFWLSETPEAPSRGWDAALNRICTYGRFRHRESGRRFYLFNTHFDHKGEVARARSVALLLERMAAVQTQGYPVVLTGDLNLEPDSDPILLLSGKMQDAHAAAADRAYGLPGTFNGFDCESPVTRRIDYIFVSPGDFEVVRHGILSATREKGFPSDHFPVLADLRFTD
ncbi:endonuclease/exonuclease/phosphatase family protein [Robiginitalea sp. M366]|uniref:endonuclease/exonuclease/phosphatase family protein n=1 Tax=Robiginitalea aestuariiviva TaxID=3036903 RepID=UPI00240D375E|nr:endonuclease/exonuclease/phosphatase family protein [Robiginitalea aestuariiviva]MDG1571565.1 endonuclease/exonuclease/phosphatase family protein [Robiginitalea aestuariiviva]